MEQLLEEKLTESQIDIIAHSLGIRYLDAKYSDRPKDKQLPDEFFRNHYSHGKSNESFPPEIQKLLEIGLIWQYDKFGNTCFSVTEKGISEFRRIFRIEVTEKHVPLSRSKEQYRKYLDSDAGLNFAEYLNIKVPKVENKHGLIRLVSTKYYGVAGEWKRTFKEAKATYKETLFSYRRRAKAEKAEELKEANAMYAKWKQEYEAQFATQL